MKHLVLVIALAAFSTSALAEVTPEQKALVEKSLLSWTAFECSVLAEQKEDPVEAERLFMLGYDEGMEFLRAIERATEAEEPTLIVLLNAPLGFVRRMSGPTNDFRLGRIYEAATENVFDKVFTDMDQTHRWFAAKSEFRKRNCSLLK